MSYAAAGTDGRTRATGAVAAKALLFYGAMGLLLVLSVTKTLTTFLPSGAASQVGHNSEAYLLALVLAAILQWVRPAAQLTARPWVPLLGLAVVLLATAVILDRGKGSFGSSYATLNEAFFALGFITLYLILPRPVAFAPYLALALLLVIVVFNRTDLITLQAETMVALMLAPVSLDVADPTLVDRRTDDRPGARLLWCVVLVAVPVLFAILYRVGLSGIPGEIARYGRRPTEAFLGLLFIHLYFSYLLGRAWRRPSVRGETTTSGPVVG